MDWIEQRFDFLFRSTKGLILTGIAMIALTAAFFGMLSGPMNEFGISAWWVKTFHLSLLPQEREGRIIILYHSLAMAVVAIEVYMINHLLPMKKRQVIAINGAITAGYLFTMIFGLAFAYFGHNWIFHGLYMFGLSLVFFAGLLLALALWPWRKEYHISDPQYARTRRGVNMERVAFFAMAVATLISSMFGAAPGSYFGNGFESFLAEDVIRVPEKTALQLSVIGHLHIMLALIAVACALIVGRWLDFKGPLHKIAMPMMTLGAVILSMGAWMVVPFERIAHVIIYIGSGFVMLAALFLVIYGWRMLIRTRLADQGVKQAGLGMKLRALFHDPLKFGALWQMVYMNFTVSGVGIFMAVRLDKIIRVWPWREERIALTGHWHILGSIVATILLFVYADWIGLKGRVRKIFGWTVIITSNVAFFAATLFETKRLYVTESAQQELVNLSMALIDFALAALLLTLAILLVWRLADLFKKDGLWKQELLETSLAPAGEAALEPLPGNAPLHKGDGR
jgi:hypothetical protein